MTQTYLQQMLSGINDEKSKEAIKDCIIWKEKLWKEYSLTIGDLFKYLKLIVL